MVWPLEQTLPQIAWRSTVCAWALLNFVFITKNDNRGSSRVWTWLISVANAAGLAYLVLGRPSLNLLPTHWQWVAPWDQPGNPLYDAVDDNAKVWMWWGSLSLASVMNLFFLAYVMLTRSSADSDTAATRLYEWRMKWLAVPFVLQCGYRSVFPEVYAGDCAVDGPGCQATRLVFFDDPLNGVLVGRGLAAVGEIAFMVQLALAVQHLNNNLAVWSRRSSVVNVVSVLVVLLITVAEGFSYACTATTWNVYCACENSLWTTCVVLLALSAAYLYYNAEAVLGMEVDADKAARQRTTNSNSLFFCVMLFLALFTCVGWRRRSARWCVVCGVWCVV